MSLSRISILLLSLIVFSCSLHGFDDDEQDDRDEDNTNLPVNLTGRQLQNTSITTAVVVSDKYFEADMSGITITKRFASDGYDIGGTWDALKALPEVSSVYFNDIGLVPTYALQQIRPDPTGTGRNTVWSQIISDDPNTSGTTRAQMSMRFAPGLNLGVYHTSHRMYIHPDFDFLKTYTLKKIDWSIIFEIWNEDGISKGIF
ncbi:MAG: hypothetical protein ACKOYP_10880, partial [Bacteroidota bacterium]